MENKQGIGNMDKKTTRKNQTKLTVNWPSDDSFFTVKELHAANPQFKPEITVRVRLTKAIKQLNTVAVIGDKMNKHGRPEMVCAMRQKDGTVKKSTIEAAIAAGIRCNDVPTTVATNLNPAAAPAAATTTSVNLNPSQKPVNA